MPKQIYQQQPIPLIQGIYIDPVFHVVYIQFWLYHPTVAAKINIKNSSDQTLLVLQGSACCSRTIEMFFQQSLVVINSYLSYWVICWLSIISKHFVPFSDNFSVKGRSDQPVWHNHHTFKVTLFFTLMFSLNISKLSSPHLDAKMHWVAIMLGHFPLIWPIRWTGVSN